MAPPPKTESERLLLSAGYSEEAPSSQEEEELLTQLVSACLGSSEAENEELLRDVMALARAQGQCRESGVAAPNIRAVSSNVMQAVKDLKRQVGCFWSLFLWLREQGTGWLGISWVVEML
jgi:hypothetical protein